MVKLPYYLNRIDCWCYNRVDRALDRTNEEKLCIQYSTKVLKKPIRKDFEITKMRVAALARNMYRNLFSYNHDEIKKFINGEGILATILNESAKEILIEVIESCGELLRFTDLVGARALHDLNEIPDKEIDKLFLEAFQSPNNFVSLYLRFEEKGIELYSLCPGKNVGREKLESLESKLNIERVIIPFVSEISFADISITRSF